MSFRIAYVYRVCLPDYQVKKATLRGMKEGKRSVKRAIGPLLRQVLDPRPLRLSPVHNRDRRMTSGGSLRLGRKRESRQVAAGDNVIWRARRDSYSYNLRRLSKLLKTRYAKPAEISTLGWLGYVLMYTDSRTYARLGTEAIHTRRLLTIALRRRARRAAMQRHPRAWGRSSGKQSIYFHRSLALFAELESRVNACCSRLKSMQMPFAGSAM